MILKDYLLPFDGRNDGGKIPRSGGQIGLHALQRINRRPYNIRRLSMVVRGEVTSVETIPSTTSSTA